MMKTFNLNLISKYRNQLMGLAAIMIILCHIPQYGVKIPNIFSKILIYGNIGVDIFLFLSGLGCSYSLSKNPLLRKWYFKRFIRIFIPYALVQIPFWLYSYFTDSFDYKHALYIFSTVAFWTEHTGAWYVALLLPLYIITPILYYCLRNENNKYITIIFIAILIFICNFKIDNTNGVYLEILKNLQWASVRVTSFIIGMSIAPYVKKNININPFLIILFSICIYFFTHHFINENLFMWWILVLPIVIIYIYILESLNKQHRIYSFISWMGSISLESYLTNIYLCKYIKEIVIKYNNETIFTGHYLDYIAIILLGLFLAYIVNITSHKITSNIKYSF